MMVIGASLRPIMGSFCDVEISLSPRAFRLERLLERLLDLIGALHFVEQLRLAQQVFAHDGLDLGLFHAADAVGGFHIRLAARGQCRGRKGHSRSKEGATSRA